MSYFNSAGKINQLSASLADIVTNLKAYSNYVVNGDWAPAIVKAANDTPEGGTLFIPGGTQVFTVLTTPIITKAGITIRGRGKLILGAKNIYALKLSADSIICKFLNIQNPNNYVGDFTPSQAPTSGGIFAGGSHISILNCTIDNMMQSIILGNLNGTESDFIVTGNRVTNVIGCSTEWSNDGIICHVPKATVTDNYVSCKTGTVGRAGIGCDQNSPYMNFSDNIIEGPFKRSIHMENAPESIVRGNRLNGALVWGITTDSQNIIEGNTIEMPSAVPQAYGDFPVNPSCGIYMWNSKDNNVRGNIIKTGNMTTDSHGILVLNGDGTKGYHIIENNKIMGSAASVKYGINSNGKDTLIQGNKVQSGVATQDGIYIQSGGTFSEVVDNRIESNDLRMDANDCTAHGNIITGVSTGINCFNTLRSTVFGNRINSTGDGVLLNGGSGHMVYGNNIVGATSPITKLNGATYTTFTGVAG